MAIVWQLSQTGRQKDNTPTCKASIYLCLLIGNIAHGENRTQCKKRDWLPPGPRQPPFPGPLPRSNCTVEEQFLFPLRDCLWICESNYVIPPTTALLKMRTYHICCFHHLVTPVSFPTSVPIDPDSNFLQMKSFLTYTLLCFFLSGDVCQFIIKVMYVVKKNSNNTGACNTQKRKPIFCYHPKSSQRQPVNRLVCMPPDLSEQIQSCLFKNRITWSILFYKLSCSLNISWRSVPVRTNKSFLFFSQQPVILLPECSVKLI